VAVEVSVVIFRERGIGGVLAGRQPRGRRHAVDLSTSRASAFSKNSSACETDG